MVLQKLFNAKDEFEGKYWIPENWLIVCTFAIA